MRHEINAKIQLKSIHLACYHYPQVINGLNARRIWASIPQIGDFLICVVQIAVGV